MKNKEIAFFCTHDGGTGKVIDKALQAIEKGNTLIAAKDFFSPKRNMNACISQALIWVDEMKSTLV